MSDKYKLIILPEAQRDIREIVLYIARELSSPNAAINIQNEFQKGIDSLTNMPERIKPIDEHPWNEVGVHKIRIKNYYVYFLIAEEEHTVKIMAVIYTGRDQNRQMSDRGMNKI